jgi:hypothetical protein
MIPALIPSYQPHKPLLKLQKGLPIGQTPARFEVPLHHQAILKVWEDHIIIEREKVMLIQISPNPTQHP